MRFLILALPRATGNRVVQILGVLLVAALLGALYWTITAAGAGYLRAEEDRR